MLGHAEHQGMELENKIFALKTFISENSSHSDPNTPLMWENTEELNESSSEHSEQDMSEERITVDIENQNFNLSIEARVNNEGSVSSNFHESEGNE